MSCLSAAVSEEAVPAPTCDQALVCLTCALRGGTPSFSALALAPGSLQAFFAGLPLFRRSVVGSGCLQVELRVGAISLDAKGDTACNGVSWLVMPFNRRRIVVQMQLPEACGRSRTIPAQRAREALLTAADMWLPGLAALAPPSGGEWTSCRCLVSTGGLGTECVAFRVAEVWRSDMAYDIGVDVMAWYQWGGTNVTRGWRYAWPLMGALVAAVRSMHCPSPSSGAAVEYVACPSCCTEADSLSQFGAPWVGPCLIPMASVVELLGSPDVTPRLALPCGVRHRVATPALALSLLPCDSVEVLECRGRLLVAAPRPVVDHAETMPSVAPQWRLVDVHLCHERERFIGQGSFGKVLRAQLARDRTEVAVKLAHVGKSLVDLATEVGSYMALAGECCLLCGYCRRGFALPIHVWLLLRTPQGTAFTSTWCKCMGTVSWRDSRASLWSCAHWTCQRTCGSARGASL